MLRHIVILAFSSLLPVIAPAQTIHTATAQIEPAQIMSSGKLTACGLRIRLLEPPPADGLIQVQIYSSLGTPAIVIFGTERVRYAGGVSFLPNPAPASSWVRFGSSDALKLSDRKQLDERFVAYTGDPVAALKSMIELVENGLKLQVGIQQSSNADERIYSTQASIRPSAREEFRSCVKELLSRAVPEPSGNN